MMGFQNASVSPTMTPYHSDVPIDAIPDVKMSSAAPSILSKQYHSWIGVLNWLAMST